MMSAASSCSGSDHLPRQHPARIQASDCGIWPTPRPTGPDSTSTPKVRRETAEAGLTCAWLSEGRGRGQSVRLRKTRGGLTRATRPRLPVVCRWPRVVTLLSVETCVDHMATCSTTHDSGIELTVTRSHCAPSSFDATGTCSTDPARDLLLLEVWLGSPDHARWPTAAIFSHARGFRATRNADPGHPGGGWIQH